MGRKLAYWVAALAASVVLALMFLAAAGAFTAQFLERDSLRAIPIGMYAAFILWPGLLAGCVGLAASFHRGRPGLASSRLAGLWALAAWTPLHLLVLGAYLRQTL